MKYKIGYFICELKQNAMGELEPVVVSDFIPLSPIAIFENKKDAIQTVNGLQQEEIYLSIINNNFKTPGDKIKNYCYDLLEEDI